MRIVLLATLALLLTVSIVPAALATADIGFYGFGARAGLVMPEDPIESTREAQTIRAFAFLEFERAFGAFEESREIARLGFGRAAIRWQAAADAYRAYRPVKTEYVRYAEAFASLCRSLTRVESVAERDRLVREKLGEFRDYGEAERALAPR